MLRTQVRVRSFEGYVLADVLASVKVAGYTFLIHKSITNERLFSATHAPVGIGIVNYPSIQQTIDQLMEYEIQIPPHIGMQLEDLARTHTPLLAPEDGIQTEAEWRWREQHRFDIGEYKPVPQVSGLAYPDEHYLHLSVTKTETDFVAYTPNDSYGERDRQTRLKFGKYLRKTFTDLSDAEVESAVVALRAKLALAESPATLLFATDKPTISQIFETVMYACGGNYISCMCDKFTSREIRPYHVYADSPDVAVAYVLEHGQIVSRTVVSTKDKTWVRCYSIKPHDSTYCRSLEELLERKGYTEGSLIGNRLTKLPRRGNSEQLPYIDHGGLDVSDQGKYWKVVSNGAGDYTCDSTDGTVSSHSPRCSGCDCAEDDCQCSYCECCEERYPDGCDRCVFCEQCEGCREHGACSCNRCESCDYIVNPDSIHTRACRCERCVECGDLETECGCDKCDECYRLTEDCECEKETETETEAAEVAF